MAKKKPSKNKAVVRPKADKAVAPVEELTEEERAKLEWEREEERRLKERQRTIMAARKKRWGVPITSNPGPNATPEQIMERDDAWETR